MKFMSLILLLLLAGCGNEELGNYSFYEETENWEVSLDVEEKSAGENITEEAELILKYVGEEPVPNEIEVIIDTTFQYRGQTTREFEGFNGTKTMPFGNQLFIGADRAESPFTLEIIWEDETEEFVLTLEQE